MAIDLSKLSPAQLDKFIHLQSILAGQAEAAAIVCTLRDYYDGLHPIYLSDRQKEYLEPALKKRQTSGTEAGDVRASLTEGEFTFSQNTVKSVIDTLRERLSVSGFTVNGAALGNNGDETTSDNRIATQMWAWWEENRFDAQQIRLHRRALRDGKSYVMVDYDSENGRPRFTLHPVDDGKTGITYHRDPEMPDRVLFANKHWWTFNPLEPGKTGDRRKTTYLPYEIRKYIMGKTGEWEPVQDPGDLSWPIPWRDAQGAPLGIPIIEFENPGGSEVAQIIGLQNALNKTWLDLLAAADAAGFPLLVTEYPPNTMDANVTDDDDIEGDDEFVMAPGRMLETEGHVHRIEMADLRQLIDTIHVIVETIAGISRTPQYYLRPVGGSDVPSGEALKQLESGLVSRAIERHLIFGQAWADVMAMAYRVARTFGPALPEAPNLKVQTLWESAATRQELTDAQRGEILKRLGVPDEVIWELLGFSPEQIAKWKQTMRADDAVRIATVAQAVLTRQGGASPNAPALPAPTEATPENINSTEGLNGIQIRAAVELVEKVSRGELAPSIALELLISLGIERTRAQRMVEEAQRFDGTPPVVNVGPTANNGNGVQ